MFWEVGDLQYFAVCSDWSSRVTVGLSSRSKEWKIAWSSGAQMWKAWRCWWSIKPMTSWHRGPCTILGEEFLLLLMLAALRPLTLYWIILKGGGWAKGRAALWYVFGGVSGLLLCNPLVLGVKISLCANISGTDHGSSHPALEQRGQRLRGGWSVSPAVKLWEDVNTHCMLQEWRLFARWGGSRSSSIKCAREVPDHCMWYYFSGVGLRRAWPSLVPSPSLPCSSLKAALSKSFLLPSFSTVPPLHLQ